MKPLALVLAGMLALTACGGGSENPEPETSASAEASQPAAQDSDAPGLAPKSGAPLAEPTESGKPAPTPKPNQVKALVGTWQGDTPAKEHFVFTADGSGKLVASGKELWAGTVIPAGKKIYRLSWQGTDPGAAYWQIELNAGGDEITFAANAQVYKKVKKPAAADTTKKPTT
ncbi:hypothetical protein [Actinocorallia populi]|uniref:hypothetical protein n=1 Tax=Actinocorallia populi TaxID=2079200 RepID=UPI000D0902E4|nr:hypothetical protein [Actinocorallia populi]